MSLWKSDYLVWLHEGTFKADLGATPDKGLINVIFDISDILLKGHNVLCESQPAWHLIMLCTKTVNEISVKPPNDCVAVSMKHTW